jgi:hypothetical protein
VAAVKPMHAVMPVLAMVAVHAADHAVVGSRLSGNAPHSQDRHSSGHGAQKDLRYQGHFVCSYFNGGACAAGLIRRRLASVESSRRYAYLW